MLRIKRPKKHYSYNEIYNFIRLHESSMSREIKLKDYYSNHNDIVHKQRKGDGKANVKASHPFANKLTSTFVGYFSGNNPLRIDYEDDAIKEQIDDFMKYNDVEKLITKLTIDACIYGESVAMTFIDKKGMVRVAPVETNEIIVLVGNDILEEPHHVIRHWKAEDNSEHEVHYVEIYDEFTVSKFYIEVENERGEIKVRETGTPTVIEHLFQDVPFAFFKLADDGLGLYERCIPLIDCYDLAVSTTMDSLIDLTDSILLVAGCELDEEVMQQVRELRILNSSETGVNVEYVNNQIPSQEEIKDRLRRDIFSLCGIVDIDSEEWGNATSGTSLRLRLTSMEYKASVTSSYFVEGVRRLFELWGNIAQLTGKLNVDELVSNISIQMVRNTIGNEQETVANAIQLSSVLSKETIINLLKDFVPSVDVELERLAKEKEENALFMQDYGHDDFENESEDDKDDKSEEDVDKDDNSTTNEE